VSTSRRSGGRAEARHRRSGRRRSIPAPIGWRKPIPRAGGRGDRRQRLSPRRAVAPSGGDRSARRARRPQSLRSRPPPLLRRCGLRPGRPV